MAKDERRYNKTSNRGAPEFEYTQEIAKEICDYVATHTESVADMVKNNPHFPKEDTIRRWRLYRDDFGAKYARAKQLQAELMAEEVLEIADRKDCDTIINKEGDEICNHEWIARSRLRIDTRKWIACKLAPKLYGDKQTVEQTINLHENVLKELT